MPSKLIMTFKRASWTQSINLDIGLQFLLTTKCHQEPKKNRLQDKLSTT